MGTLSIVKTLRDLTDEQLREWFDGHLRDNLGDLSTIMLACGRTENEVIEFLTAEMTELVKHL